MTDIIITLASFKTGGLGIALLSINRIKLGGENVYYIDSKDFNLATFIGRALTFETPISDQKLVWSQKYGDLLEAKGKDSMQFEI